MTVVIRETLGPYFVIMSKHYLFRINMLYCKIFTFYLVIKLVVVVVVMVSFKCFCGSSLKRKSILHNGHWEEHTAEYSLPMPGFKSRHCIRFLTHSLRSCENSGSDVTNWLDLNNR